MANKRNELCNRANELGDTNFLINSVPEFIPYRNEEKVKNLFKNLNIASQNMLIYDNCIVVQLNINH